MEQCHSSQGMIYIKKKKKNRSSLHDFMEPVMTLFICDHILLFVNKATTVSSHTVLIRNKFK